MTKILITGDLHFRSGNPLARKDSFIEAVTAKLYEIAELADLHDVKAIIIPGDIFDSASVSIPTVVHLAKILKEFPCPVLTVPGNHDTFGHNLNSLPRTPYGLLSQLGYIWCLHSRPLPWRSFDISIAVYGHGFDSETDFNLLQYGLPKPKDSSDTVYIHVAHGMLLDEAPGNQERYTLVSKLAEIPEKLQPHVLVCGHYHFGLKLQRVGKTLIINPGALSRINAHVNEISRPVQVALLKINSVDDYDAEFIPLRSALPGDKVLSRKHIEQAQARNEKLNKFLSLLASEGESKFLEVRDIVEDIAARENLPEKVKREALERIGKAREQLAKVEVGNW